MRLPNALGPAACLLAAGLLACGASDDERTTLAELERGNAGVQVSIERDVCSCSCGKLICWDFTCSGNGCSSADEYELVVERDPGAGDGRCFEAEAGLTAQLIDEDEEPLTARAATHGCDELSFLWRGPRAGLASRPHRIEISDASETWSIDDPFRSTSLAVIAPESAVPTSPTVAATVQVGDAIAFALTSPAELTDVHASLVSAVTHESIELPVGAVREDGLEVVVAPGTPSGLYDLQLGAGTLLPSGACHGPAVCQGIDAGTSLALRVE